MAKQKLNRSLNILITENVHQLLKTRAFYDNRSIGEIVREAIGKHVQPVRKGEHDR